MSAVDWEHVNTSLERIRVPGGWLYRNGYATAPVFVPELQTVYGPGFWREHE